jgi:hypothetical protein
MRVSTQQIPIISPPTQGKLIFNAGSGKPEESLQQLATILSEMQDQQILPEVYTTRPDSQIEEVVHSAIKSGIKLIVVAGGDGTIDSIAGAMVEVMRPQHHSHRYTKQRRFNLGSQEISQVLSPPAPGSPIKIDVGRVHCGHPVTGFWKVLH